MGGNADTRARDGHMSRYHETPFLIPIMSNKISRHGKCKRPVIGILMYMYMCSSLCQSSPECKITEGKKEKVVMNVT